MAVGKPGTEELLDIKSGGKNISLFSKHVWECARDNTPLQQKAMVKPEEGCCSSQRDEEHPCSLRWDLAQINLLLLLIQAAGTQL